jgi:hypothetical protein
LPSSKVKVSYASWTCQPDDVPEMTSGAAKGTASAFSGDVGMNGTAEARFTITPDRRAPTWRAEASASFASVALPWDVRTILASEPYEETLHLASMHATSTVEVTPIATAILWGTSPRDRQRGLSIRAGDWDSAPGLRVSPDVVRDFAGNAAATSAPTGFGGVVVKLLESSVLEPNEGLATTWGATKVTKDADGKAVYAIGPFTHSYCSRRSAGGLAARLVGSGAASVLVRAVATPKGLGGGGLPVSQVVYVQTATIGAPPRTDGSAVKWPTTAGAGGVFDTGWTTVTLATPGSGAETGVAVSAGGTGPGGDDGSCGLAPPGFETMVYVQRISVVGGK